MCPYYPPMTILVIKTNTRGILRHFHCRLAHPQLSQLIFNFNRPIAFRFQPSDFPRLPRNIRSPIAPSRPSNFDPTVNIDLAGLA